MKHKKKQRNQLQNKTQAVNLNQPLLLIPSSFLVLLPCEFLCNSLKVLFFFCFFFFPSLRSFSKFYLQFSFSLPFTPTLTTAFKSNPSPRNPILTLQLLAAKESKSKEIAD
jgi:hypothetical protein